MPPTSASAPTPARILMKSLGVPFLLGLAGRRRLAAAFALVFGFFCVRLTHLLRHADARLRADRVGHLLQVERGHRRRAGLPNVPYPGMAWIELRCPCGRRSQRSDDQFFYLTLVLVGAVLAGLRRIVAFAVRPHAHRDPREPRARAVHRRQRAPLPAGRLRRWRASSRASPARCSASSTAACSPTSATGPSRPRC